MANLNSFQKLTRVLPTQPWGNGKDGAYSSATIPTYVELAVTGTATETHIHATAANFVVDDVILLHQYQGTGAGQWEINKITADNGDGTYNVFKALQYTYASGARAIEVLQYTNSTVEAGTWSGNLVLACSNTLTVTGTIGSGGGHGGGAGSDTGYQGTSYNGAGGKSTGANAGGGGGGYDGNGSSGGGGSGGGYGAAGTSASGSNGGGAYGSSDLTSLFYGSGGGGGGDRWGEMGSNGGSGGGAVIGFIKNLVINGAISAGGSGGASAGGDRGPGGGGSGGSILLVCKTATLGTNLITSSGGAGGVADNNGGAGAVGIIAVHHYGTITGTTTPSFTDVTDTSLTESSFLGAMI